MKIKLFFIVTILLSTNLFFSQDQVDFGPMEPEQQNVSREENDDSNGSYSIPIYTVKSGNITYPITLSYDMSGIGVDDVASDVGLGWSLSESFVSREVMDKVDVDETEGGVFPAWSAMGYEGQNFATYPLYNIDQLRKKGYQQVKNNNIIEHYDTNIGELDHEPDIFNVVAPTFVTSFYYPVSLEIAKELYNKDSQISQEIGDVVIDYTDAKFDQHGILKGANRIFKDYKSFSVKQSNGILSTFNEINYIHTMNLVRFLGNQSINNQYDYNTADSRDIPMTEKWLISTIHDPRTSRTVGFSYETYSTEDNHFIYHPAYVSSNKPYFRDGLFFAYNYNVQNNTFVTPDCYIFHDPGEEHHQMYGKIYKRYIKKKRIAEINFDSGKILFKYDLNREDFHNGKALTRIEIWNKENMLVDSYDFVYGYFTSEQYRNEYSKRLKLLSVTQMDGKRHAFEYYEDNKMPQIGSYNKDFFGYCNTSNDDLLNPEDENAINYPIYYYYPDKYEFSLLPYNITGQQKFLIQGVINKEPNELAKTWSLKKVKLPAGGNIQFNLETNVFNLWGQNLKGPGLRLKSKMISESSSDPNPRIVIYNYNLSNGNSSGSIYNFPLAGYPVKKLFNSYEDDYGIIHSGASSYNGEPNLYKSFLLFQALTKNKAEIKYSNVQKIEGDKRTDFEYAIHSSRSKRYYRYFNQGNGINDFGPHCISEFLFTNSGVGKDNTSPVLSYLISKKIYENAIKLKENNLFYKNVFIDDATFSNPPLYYFQDQYIRGAKTSFDILPGWGYENLILYDREYFTRSNYLVKEINTDYLANNTLTTTTNFEYQNVVSGKSPMLRAINTADSVGNIYATELFLPTDQYVDLVNENLLNIPLGKKITKNDKEIFHSEIPYMGLLPGGELSISPFQNVKENIIYDAYDDKGNLLSYRKSDGTPVSIIWGYNQTLPIAILEGIEYSALLQEIYYSQGVPNILDLEIVKRSNLDIDSFSEEYLIQELDKFRTNPMFDGYQLRITTYTYNTLIGLTSVTPPSGIRQKYLYNASNKLEKIVDINGKTLKEIKYNYKQ